MFSTSQVDSSAAAVQSTPVATAATGGPHVTYVPRAAVSASGLLHDPTQPVPERFQQVIKALERTQGSNPGGTVRVTVRHDGQIYQVPATIGGDGQACLYDPGPQICHSLAPIGLPLPMELVLEVSKYLPRTAGMVLTNQRVSDLLKTPGHPLLLTPPDNRAVAMPRDALAQQEKQQLLLRHLPSLTQEELKTPHGTWATLAEAFEAALPEPARGQAQAFFALPWQLLAGEIKSRDAQSVVLNAFSSVMGERTPALRGAVLMALAHHVFTVLPDKSRAFVATLAAHQGDEAQRGQPGQPSTAAIVEVALHFMGAITREQDQAALLELAGRTLRDGRACGVTDNAHILTADGERFMVALAGALHPMRLGKLQRQLVDLLSGQLSGTTPGAPAMTDEQKIAVTRALLRQLPQVQESVKDQAREYAAGALNWLRADVRPEGARQAMVSFALQHARGASNEVKLSIAETLVDLLPHLNAAQQHGVLRKCFYWATREACSDLKAAAANADIDAGAARSAMRTQHRLVDMAQKLAQQLDRLEGPRVLPRNGSCAQQNALWAIDHVLEAGHEFHKSLSLHDLMPEVEPKRLALWKMQLEKICAIELGGVDPWGDVVRLAGAVSSIIPEIRCRPEGGERETVRAWFADVIEPLQCRNSTFASLLRDNVRRA